MQMLKTAVTLEIQNDGTVNVRANLGDLPWVGRIAAAIMEENDQILEEIREGATDGAKD